MKVKLEDTACVYLNYVSDWYEVHIYQIICFHYYLRSKLSVEAHFGGGRIEFMQIRV